MSGVTGSLAIHGKITVTPPGLPRDVLFILIRWQTSGQTVFSGSSPASDPGQRSEIMPVGAAGAVRIAKGEIPSTARHPQVAYQKWLPDSHSHVSHSATPRSVC